MPDENGLSLLKRLRTQNRSFAPLFSAFMTPDFVQARSMPAPAAI